MTDEERLAFEVEQELQASKQGNTADASGAGQSAGAKKRGPPRRKVCSVELADVPTEEGGE